MALHVAAVYAADGIGVRLLTAASSAEALTARVATYVERQAEYLLWPADAERVRALLAEGKRREAVELYFAKVGERWERERLRTEVVETR